jgi:hypothetical protein
VSKKGLQKKKFQVAQRQENNFFLLHYRKKKKKKKKKGPKIEACTDQQDKHYYNYYNIQPKE